MLAYHQNFVVDKTGKRVGIILDIESFQHLIEAKEELEAIRSYDEAKTHDDTTIPFEQTVVQIENDR